MTKLLLAAPAIALWLSSCYSANCPDSCYAESGRCIDDAYEDAGDCIDRGGGWECLDEQEREGDRCIDEQEACYDRGCR